MSDDDLTLRDRQDRVRQRAAAYLTLYSESESPEVLAQKIGLAPDDAWSKDDPRGILRKPAPSSAIRYESGLAEGRSPSDHVSALADRLRPFGERIRVVTSREDAWGGVRIVEHAGFAIAEHGIANVEAWIRPEEVATFAAMGLSVGFDAYLYADED